MNTLLGIDLGTTSLKVALVAEEGRLIATEAVAYPILAPQPGYAEQDPAAWWDGCVLACQRLRTRFPTEMDQVAGIGICGQMHTQVLLDSAGRVLRPAITWMDQRSREVVDAINRDPAARALVFEETSNLAATTYTAPQVRWLQEHEPEVWHRAAHVLVAKDYLKYRLTGEMLTDHAEASGTLLFDVRRCAWSPAMAELFGIHLSMLPAAQPSDVIAGRITPAAAAATGLKAGTPVANGSSDNSAAALGAGMLQPGQVTLIIGTAGVVTVCSDRPLPDPLHRTLCWCYCLRDRWVTLGVMQTAGESLEWFRHAFEDAGEDGALAGDVFAQYSQAAAQVPAGAGGLVFLPYLNGERTPYWDPYARGVFFGINLATAKAHFIRAIMEGVSFGLRHNVETVEALGIVVDEVRAVGGGLKSPVWLDILGQVLRRPVVTVEVPDTANLGNVLLCGHALGLYPSLADASAAMVRTGHRVHFTEGSQAYERQYAVFLELYQQLRETFRR
jgi:xylulokinase